MDMASLLSPLLDNTITPLWNCTSKHISYIIHLEKNLHSLRNEMDELKRVYNDAKTLVKLAEEQQMKRTETIDSWLSEVEDMEKVVNGILQKGDREIQKKCLGGYCCPRNCKSSYKLGKNASKKLNSIIELKKKRSDIAQAVATRLPRGPVDDQPAEQTVGMDLTFERVCICLEEEKVRIVGIYGMGGVGKTTLMKRINNEFLKTSRCEFDIAIWAVVSKPLDVEKIQQLLLNRLQVPENEWRSKSKNEKATDIHRLLQTKTCVLLLDDMWEHLDLLEVGVPPPNGQNKSKVIFTTRSEELCMQMCAHRTIGVETLNNEAAMALFKTKVGEDTLSAHPDIQGLAKHVANECKGLPLALVTVGRAMFGKKKPQDWERALETLKRFPARFPGMASHVFPVLKFSYDSLDNEVLKSCFVYCSIFPEDYTMRVHDLIHLWIGEGYFDDIKDGEDIIEKLKFACLLMEDSAETEDMRRELTVRMHDVLRDMALWLGCECGEKKNKFLVQEEEDVTKWQEAEKVVLLDPSNNVQQLFDGPLKCPNLLTLIVRDTDINKFLNGFFQFSPAITVLDLSGNGKLYEIPSGISKLGNLQYLNLSDTNAIELPVDLKNLTKLRCFRLNGLRSMTILTREVIASLSYLRVFELLKHSLKPDSEYALLEELESLNHVTIASITIVAHSAARKFLSSPKLHNSTRHLSVDHSDMSSLDLQSSMRLHQLSIHRCLELKEVKVVVPKFGREKEKENDHQGGGCLVHVMRMRDGCFSNLTEVIIRYCDNLLDLTWLIYIPKLQILAVYGCESIQEIICGGEDDDHVIKGLFSRLAELTLSNLPRLRSIYGQALLLPSLEKIHVVRCPKLKRLPLNVNSAKDSLKHIRGLENWWNGLQFKDEFTKSHFQEYFQE